MAGPAPGEMAGQRMQRMQANRSRAQKLSDAFADEGVTLGSSEMTLERIHQILDSDRRMYYRSHDLNDKLYIHFQGFRKIQNLEGFTGLRSLFAEANAIEKLSGLENCVALRSLFVQQNCIKTIEGLENCPLMWNMNLSENWIETIENIEHLRELNSLNIQKNRIGVNGLKDLICLREMNLATVDLSDNKVSDPEVIPQIFAKMRDLRVLYLKGNPVVKLIPHYRKTVIAMLPNLRYLDDRPVFAEDRRTSEAFVAGGLEGEREMRRIMKQEKEDSHAKQMAAFKRMMEDAKEAKREIRGMRGEDKYTDETDPVETWKQRQERFTRENPEYDYQDAGKWDKKFDSEKPTTGTDDKTTSASDLAKPKEEAKADEKPKSPKAESVVTPPAPDWDADIFGETPSKPSASSNVAVQRTGGTPARAPPPHAPAPAEASAAKAATKESEERFQPPPRAPAAFGPRGKNVNELDELD